MTRQESAPSPTSEPEAAPSPRRRRLTRARTSAAGVWAGRASAALTFLLLAAAVVGGVLAFEPLRQRAAALRAREVSVIFEWPALGPAPSGGHAARAVGWPGAGASTWLSEPYRHELVALAQRTLTSDPFDAAALERTRQALLDTGWFAAVHSVRREPVGVVAGGEPAGRVRVVASWRTPAAVVRHGESDYLISADAERLPLKYPHGGSGLRVIEGVSFDPPEKLGQRWLGAQVPAALELLATLQASPGYAQVAGVDVSRYAEQKRLTIITDRGTRVVWGSAPSDFAPLEPAVATKLHWLAYFATSPEHGRRIDGRQSVLDLSNPRGVVIDATGAAGASGPAPALPVRDAAPAEAPAPGGGGGEAIDQTDDADDGLSPIVTPARPAARSPRHATVLTVAAPDASPR